TINSVGTFRNIDTSVYLDDHADFIAWARSTGATTVSRGQFDDLAYGYLCDGTPVTVRTRKPRRPEGAVAFTLAAYAAGGGVRRAITAPAPTPAMPLPASAPSARSAARLPARRPA